MPSTRDLRRRIKSVKATAQMTRAQQMIAATRMQRAQRRVLAARPYSEQLADVLASLAKQTVSGSHPLLAQRPVRSIAIVHVTPDRGLCGPLISNINRAVSRFVVGQSHPVRLIAVGRKARDFGLRAGLPLLGEFTGLRDQPNLVDTAAIAHKAILEFEEGRVDAVYLAYTRYVSAMTQQVVLRQILPVMPSAQPDQPAVGQLRANYLFEPEADDVLSALLPRYIEVQIYQAVLESQASEHSGRMVAMRNATDNAKELAREYTLILNKTRQASITREIAEISAGAAALSDA